MAASYEVANDYGVGKEAARALLEVPAESRPLVMDEIKERGAEATRSLILDVHDEIVEKVVDQTVTDRTGGDLDIAGMKQLVTMIKKCGNELRVLIERPEGSHIPFDRVITDLINAEEAVKMSIPTHTCPICSGKSCKFCNGTGYVPNHLYEVAKP